MASRTNYGSSAAAQPDHLWESEQSRFSQLCDSVGTNIFTVNAGSTTLERILKQIGTPRDKPDLRDNIHATQQKTNKVILFTTKLIRELTNLSKSADKQGRLRTERLRNDFQDAVQRYTRLQKQMADKIRLTYGFHKAANPYLEEENQNESNEKVGLLEDHARQTFAQQQVMRDLEFEQTLIAEREERIRQLEENILDVNQIFRDLGTMVHEQGEVINTIEANIDRTSHNVESGTAQLTKAAQLQKQYRTKICCFALIIAVIAIVLVVVLVISLKT